MEFFENLRGNRSLLYDGFEYNKSRESTNGISTWRCKLTRTLGCKAIMKTNKDEVVVQPSPHCHKSSPQKALVNVALSKMKNNIKRDGANIKHVIENEINSLDGAVIDHFPKKASIERFLRRHKALASKTSNQACDDENIETTVNPIEEMHCRVCEGTDEPEISEDENHKIVQYSHNSKGNRSLLYRSFEYNKWRENANGTVIWRCKMSKSLQCNSFLKVKGDEVLAPPSSHSHKSCPQKLMADLAIRNMKKLIVCDGADINDIIENEISGMDKSILYHLPKKSVIEKRLKKYKACVQSTNLSSDKDKIESFVDPKEGIDYKPSEIKHEAKISGVEINETMEFSVTARGNTALSYLGFEYNKYRENNATNVITWRCKMSRNLGCKSMIKTKDNDVFVPHTLHCHDSCPQKAIANVALSKMKNAIKNANTNNKNVIKNTIDGLDSAVLEHLPKKASIIRLLTRHKTRSRISDSTDFHQASDEDETGNTIDPNEEIYYKGSNSEDENGISGDEIKKVLKFSLNSKGNCVLSYDGFKYNKFWENVTNDVVKWKCKMSKTLGCKSFMKTKEDFVVASPTSHCHDSCSQYTIANSTGIKIKNNIYNIAPSKKKIIQNDIGGLNSTVLEHLPNKSSLEKVSRQKTQTQVSNPNDFYQACNKDETESAMDPNEEMHYQEPEGKHGDTNSGNEINEIMEYLQNARGNRVLFYLGFEYNKFKENVTTNTITWRCKMSKTFKCKAFVKTNRDKIVTPPSFHSHDSCPQKAKANIAMIKMKNSVMFDGANIKNVMENEMKNLDTAVLEYLPKKSTIERALAKHRSSGQFLDFTDFHQVYDEENEIDNESAMETN